MEYQDRTASIDDDILDQCLINFQIDLRVAESQKNSHAVKDHGKASHAFDRPLTITWSIMFYHVVIVDYYASSEVAEQKLLDYHSYSTKPWIWPL